MKYFAFTISNMNVIGGIETVLYRLAMSSKSAGHGVIFFRQAGCQVDESFSKLLTGTKVIPIDPLKPGWIRKVALDVEPDDEIVMFTAYMTDFAILEQIKKKYRRLKIQSVYWIPHFTGKMVYFDEWFPKALRPLAVKFLSSVYQKMEDNNHINYGNQTHYDAFVARYGTAVKGELPQKFMKSIREARPFPEHLVREKAKRDEFHIVSVSRFSFPHKGYLIGLVQAFGRMFPSHPNLKLTVIGYGPDAQRLHDEVAKLDPDCRQHVSLPGKAAPDALADYFDSAHLNVGVAGALGEGARCGVISIPVRHYTEVCEGYGFLPESAGRRLSQEPGTPIETYITQVLEMDDESFVQLSRASYDTYADRKDSAIDALMAWKNTNQKSAFSASAYLFFLTAKRFANLFPKLKRGRNAEKETA